LVLVLGCGGGLVEGDEQENLLVLEDEPLVPD
jgi:hypothetical protein